RPPRRGEQQHRAWPNPPTRPRDSAYGEAVNRPGVIDLGLLPAADAEREPPAPARPAGRHWTPHHSYWAAALAALLLLLTGASAAQPPPWPVPHFTLAARALTGGIFLTEDILLVAEQSSDRLLDFTA